MHGRFRLTERRSVGSARVPGAAGDDLAICFLAFDRPHYFRQVVDSVCRQSHLDAAQVYCFLDGSVNPFSHCRRGSRDRITRCAGIFTARFPGAELHQSPINLGIAMNYDRAERYVFIERRHRYVLFLEDDFVLQPHYLRAIRAMIREFGEHPRIGAFSAFGDHNAKSNVWVTCGLSVCRASDGSSANAVTPRTSANIRRVDFQMRSFGWIQQIYRRWGTRSAVSSQDGAKMIAGLRAGHVKISTYTNNGHYIGRHGVHFSPRIFARFGYGELANLVYREPEDRFDWTTADLDHIETILKSISFCNLTAPIEDGPY